MHRRRIVLPSWTQLGILMFREREESSAVIEYQSQPGHVQKIVIFSHFDGCVTSRPRLSVNAEERPACWLHVYLYAMQTK